MKLLFTGDINFRGLSDYFRLLNEDLQDDIIKRTEIKG